MYDMRFPGEDTTSLTLQQLRGRESTHIRRLYTQHAERTGVPWTKRDYKPGDAFAAGDEFHRLLSAANSALYGICHAAVTGLGAIPALGFVHTRQRPLLRSGRHRPLQGRVHPPLAFDLAAQSLTSERDARTAGFVGQF